MARRKYGHKSRKRSIAAKKGWEKRRGRRTPAVTHISPVAHLARKVQGLDSRVIHLEQEVGTIPKHYVRRKKKHKRGVGSLENGTRGHEYWATGE